LTQRTDETGVHRPIEEAVDRRGWLPIRTNAFDRWFIAVVVLIAIHLLWMRFLEAYVPLFVATTISLMVGYGIVRHG
jgi:predicted small integral membrane protein